MIARAIWLFVLLIAVPDIWIYRRYIHHKGRPLWVKVLWVLQTILLLAFTVYLLTVRDFSPRPQTPLNVYLFILGLWTVPKAIYAFSDSVGRLIRKRFASRFNWGAVIGAIIALAAIDVTIEGSTRGYRQLEVNRVDYYSDQLPASFDGYRIAVFSDIHLGSYNDADSTILNTALDSLRLLRPDAVFFLGDIQNTQPAEIRDHLWALGRVKAADGVFSIMGNHDYSKYCGGTPEEKAANERETKALQRQLGWRLLLNEHTILRHGTDSVFIAGVEGNEEKGCKEGHVDVPKAVEGIPDSVFTIMLAHNPRYWRCAVLPHSQAQLTLSGHTHGGQVKLFGLSPTEIIYKEDVGMYEQEGRHLFVTKGIGALIPFRYGVPGEVVLLTLHRSN